MSVGIGGAIIGGAVIGGGLAFAGASMTAGATESAGQAQYQAAMAQVQLAQKQLDAQIQARKDAVALAQQYGPLNPSEISSINKVISTRDAALNSSLLSIKKQQSVLDAMDPSVKAAGQNLYEALTKETSNATSPVLVARERQRNELKGQLQSSMGPGFMTSSAGIEAMTKFDEQTNQLFLSAQQGAVANYTTLAGLQFQGQNAVTANTGEAFGRALTADSNVLQAEQFGANRTLTAVTGSYSANQPNFMAPVGAQGSVVSTAGNPFAGSISMGSSLGQIGGGLGQVGGQLAGMNMLNNYMTANSTGNYSLPDIPSSGSYTLPTFGAPAGSSNANPFAIAP